MIEWYEIITKLMKYEAGLYKPIQPVAYFKDQESLCLSHFTKSKKFQEHTDKQT
jgi:hypothetical protein